MRVIIQRVSRAKVEVQGVEKGKIEKGLLVFCGFEESDGPEDLAWTARKIVHLRIFGDAQGAMNLSIGEIGGNILIISQFTLHAKTKKGNRPSFIQAATPDRAIPLYEQFIRLVGQELGNRPETGVFGAMMNIELVNDGPVTLFIDSKNRE